MGVSLNDVPDRYDVVFQLNDGTLYGFVLSDALESSLPFRTHKANYSYSPTFLERQNVSDLYGDQFQDFFLTGSQNDWSLGEQQQYFRVKDVDRVRRYWQAQNVDPISIPGQVTLRNTAPSLSFSETIQACTSTTNLIYLGGNTTLYQVDKTGTITSLGAHGLGASPFFYGLTSDGHNIFLGSSAGGTVGVRKYSIAGATFSTFSATASDSLVVNNNILFGYNNSTGAFQSYDTTGNPTTIFTWKDASGTALTGSNYYSKLKAYGGKVYLLRQHGYTNNGELWQYDGSGVSLLAQFPPNFSATDFDVSSGICFISGLISDNNQVQPAIFYYINNTLGRLWQSKVTGYTGSTPSSCVSYGEGIIITDPANGAILQYNLATGGVHTVGTYSVVSTSTPVMAGIKDFVCYIPNSNSGWYYPSSTISSTGYIQTSLFDFDNTLNKIFRAIKIDATIPTGATVDIAYQIDSLSGSWTTLQTGAATGTEYLLPTNTTGHSLAVQVTLNKGSSSSGPTLKRIYIRAAPTLQQFRKREYIFDLSGGYRETKGKASRLLRDMSPDPYMGIDAANNLAKVATQTVPFTVKDRFGTFTALCDLQQNAAGYDGFAIYEMRPGVFLARINLREV